MPSYVELDKQSSFPASSNSGKLIFGVTTSDQAALTDYNGVTTIIGGGSGIQIPTPIIGITGLTTDLVVHFLDQGFDFTTGNPELFLFRWRNNSKKKITAVPDNIKKRNTSRWVHPTTDDADVKWDGWKFFNGRQKTPYNGIVTGRITEFEVPSTIKPYERFLVNFNKYMFWYSFDGSNETYDVNVWQLGKIGRAHV